MILSELHILPTHNTPEFLFSPDGILKIKGRGMFQNKNEAIEQIMNWIDDYLNNPAAITQIFIAFEYLNSFSTMILVSIIRKLTKVILSTEKLVIQWYYEEDDDDILEMGEYVSETSNIPVTFIPTANITDIK